MYVKKLNHLYIIFKNTLIYLFLVLFLNSCSLNEMFYDDTNDLVKNEELEELNTCPNTYIPNQTVKFTSNKYKREFLVKIKKVSLRCRTINTEIDNQLLTNLSFKADLLFLSKNSINKVNRLPKLYIAVVDNNSEKVLAKVLSNLDISKIKGKFIINEKKFKFKFNKDQDINIYFGLE